MELNNIELNFNKIINLFEYKIKEYELIEIKIDMIYNNIINTLDNNEILFKNKIITDKNYKNNLDNINNIYVNLDKIRQNKIIFAQFWVLCLEERKKRLLVFELLLEESFYQKSSLKISQGFLFRP